MKRLILFFIALMCFGNAFSQNVNYTVEVVQFRMSGCDDGAGSDEEPTWKAWAQDNNGIGSPASSWQGGTCFFVDGNEPFAYNPTGGLVILNETNTDATVLDFRYDAWEDDCDGGSGSDRCAFGSCFFGTQSDDDREQPTFAGYNFRDSLQCEWHTVENTTGCWTWVLRFKWEYTDFDPGTLIQSVCGDSVVMSAQGSGQWSIVSGGSGGFSSNNDPTATFGGILDSSYTLQWQTYPDCMTFNSQDIQVDLHSDPDPNISVLSTNICQFADIDFTASNGDTYDWALNSPSNVIWNDTTLAAFTHSNATLTDSVVYVEATDLNGCVGLDSAYFNVIVSPVISLGNDTTICNGSSIDLEANDSVLFTNYAWNTGESSSNLTVSSPGQYIVTLTNTDFCTNSDTINIGYYNAISIPLSSNEEMCIGDSVIGDAGSGFVSYLWDDLSTSQTNTFYGFGTYQVTVTDTNNCEGTASIIVGPDYFSYTLMSDTTISLGAAIDLTANPGLSYDWNTGDTTQTVTVSPTGDVTYTATTLLPNGCFEVGTVNVFVNEELNVFIPNLFSPNGDGNNDSFLLYGFGVNEIDFRIYNRWGKEVWASQDLTEIQTTGWDGMSNGEEQPSGTYVWKLIGTTLTGDPLDYQGSNQGTLLLRR